MYLYLKNDILLGINIQNRVAISDLKSYTIGQFIDNSQLK